MRIRYLLFDRHRMQADRRERPGAGPPELPHHPAPARVPDHDGGPHPRRSRTASSSARLTGPDAVAANAELIVVSNRLPYVLEAQAATKWSAEARVGRPGHGAPSGAARPGRHLDRLAGHSPSTCRTSADIFRRRLARGRLLARAGGPHPGRGRQATTTATRTRASGRCSTTCSPSCNFDPEYWHAYVKVNRKFAQRCSPRLPAGRLRLGPRLPADGRGPPRCARPSCPADLAFFLHIPFPSPDIFMKLPERQAVLDSLLAYDLVGFQTAA